ncbi:MAG TPA: hypothetical protein G4O02_00810 [Caldilineae bacterium]|jgi:hypothetical protein|nr:hypothetical protein [Caldilineae bacterium]
MNHIHTWANVALIFLIILSMIAWAIPLTLLVLSVKGMRDLRRHMEGLMPRAQWRTHQAADAVQRGGRRVVRPLIKVHAWWAGAQAAARTLWQGISPRHSDHDDEVKP